MSKQFYLFYPVKPVMITQEFGYVGFLDWYKQHGINFKGHNGIDFRAPHGTPVYATHEGTVTFAGEDGSGGYGVVIRTNEPYQYKDTEAYFKTIYWHLVPNIPVKVGTKVIPGDLLGYADNTGLSAGDHLHFGLKPQQKGENNWTWCNVENDNGYYGAINPSTYWNRICAQDAMSMLQTLKDLVAKLGQLVALKK